MCISPMDARLFTTTDNLDTTIPIAHRRESLKAMNSCNQKLRKDDCFNTNHANRDPDCVRILTLPLSHQHRPATIKSVLRLNNGRWNERQGAGFGHDWDLLQDLCCRHRTDAGAYNILRPACEL